MIDVNFLNVFEQRIGSLFGATAQGTTAPFSFKKLAKKAAREMEAQTYVLNGVDTAPALYTILVSSDDDMIMRPLYAQLTQETAQFIEGQAQAKGYVFVGRPVVRFLADPSLKSGRFSVFAENVDVNTLNSTREEEARFLGIGVSNSNTGGLGGAAAELQKSAQSAAADFAAGVQPVQAVTARPAQSNLQPIPQPVAPASSYQAANVAPIAGVASAASVAQGASAIPQINSFDAGLDVMPQDDVMVPQTIRTPQTVPSPPATPITAMLIDRNSGQTYVVKAPRTIIGRERNAGGVVLGDPNVSRSHAELFFDGTNWNLRDLNSTNGTLVNDIDVSECALHDGDLITLGLTNLEFRGN